MSGVLTGLGAYNSQNHQSTTQPRLEFAGCFGMMHQRAIGPFLNPGEAASWNELAGGMFVHDRRDVRVLLCYLSLQKIYLGLGDVPLY